MDAGMILAEILQTALDIDADASDKKHKLASGTGEFEYQQGRADVARIFSARGIEFAQAWRAMREQHEAAEADNAALRRELAQVREALMIAFEGMGGPWRATGRCNCERCEDARIVQKVLFALSDEPRAPYEPPAPICDSDATAHAAGLEQWRERHAPVTHCGHSRDFIRGDGRDHWCEECERHTPVTP